MATEYAIHIAAFGCKYEKIEEVLDMTLDGLADFVNRS